MTTAICDFVPEQFSSDLIPRARALFRRAPRGCCDPPADLIQQVNLEAHRTQHRFKGDHPAAYKAWLFTMLESKAADSIRYWTRKRRDVRRVVSIEAALDESSANLGLCLARCDPSPSANAVTRERVERLAAALARLPAAQTEAITCHYLRDMSYKQTAEQMILTEEEVARLLRQGLKELRRLMGNGGES